MTAEQTAAEVLAAHRRWNAVRHVDSTCWEHIACRCGWKCPCNNGEENVDHTGGDTHLAHQVAALAAAGVLTTGADEGCDCTDLCSMGPTCPGGMLARLPGSGCWRTGADEGLRARVEAVRDMMQARSVEPSLANSTYEASHAANLLTAALATTERDRGEGAT